jgi:hypothetical protein
VVVAAVGVLALVAAADSLRPAGPTSPPPTVRAEQPVEPVRLAPLPLSDLAPALRAALEREHVSGTLFFLDGSCRLWGLVLPAVDWLERAPRREPCDAEPRPDGMVTTARPRSAVRPAGTVTGASGETVRACGGGSCTPVLLSPADLERAVQVRAPGGEAPTSRTIQEIGWLSDTRLVAVVHVGWRDEGASEDVVGVFEGGTLVAPPAESAQFTDLRIGPLRDRFVVHGRTSRGLWFFDRDGRVLAIDPIASGHHATWSPDGRWTAVATGGSVYLVRTGDLAHRAPPTIRVPVYARDLAWG